LAGLQFAYCFDLLPLGESGVAAETVVGASEATAVVEESVECLRTQCTERQGLRSTGRRSLLSSRPLVLLPGNGARLAKFG